jgi:hypothetical protein
VIYTIFICTVYAAMPQANSCHIQTTIAPGTMGNGREPMIYQSRGQCQQAAAQGNARFATFNGTAKGVQMKYVCMEKPGWQPVR